MAQEVPTDAFWEQLRAPYPPPPPFWKHFTTTSLERLQEVESQPDLDPSTLPFELKVLQPPPPPATAPLYTTFSQTHHLPPKPTQPPEHEEILFDPSLFTSASGSAKPHAKFLWRITKSLNLNFLELFTIMADNPIDYSDKIRGIGMLMENINAVVNLLRPHQARESVKSMLVGRIEEGRAEMERCDNMREEIEAFLRMVEGERTVDVDGEERGTAKAANGMNGVHKKETSGMEAEIEEARRRWEMLDDLDGD